MDTLQQQAAEPAHFDSAERKPVTRANTLEHEGGPGTTKCTHSLTYNDDGTRRCSWCRQPVGVVAADREAAPGRAVTKRVHRMMRARRCVWVDTNTGRGVYDTGARVDMGPRPTLARVLAVTGVDLVNMVGPRPGDGGEGFDAWRAEPGDGWAAATHYLRGARPVLRFRHDDGRNVELQRAATWFGEGRYTVDQARDALAEVERELTGRFGGCVMRVRPAATGQECFLRTVPPEGWPTLNDDLAELVRATSGQGRIEYLGQGVEPMPELCEVDGRFMYAALCRELPAGRVVRGHGGGGWPPHTRGRFDVSWRVPHNWSRPGLLPVHDGDRWRWPSAPGERARGWVDGVELHQARQFGWAVDVHAHVVWPDRARPLDKWARNIADARGAVGELAATALRAVLLYGLGAFHSAGYTTTREVALAEADAIPDGAAWWLDGGTVVYEQHETAAQARQRAPLRHPEWTSAVWARCRTRMMDGTDGAGGRSGALHVDRAALVAVHTDALYLTGAPGWPDDGKPGRLRLKQRYDGPHERPTDDAGLLRLLARLRRGA